MKITKQQIIDLALEIGLGEAGCPNMPIRNGASKYDGFLIIEEIKIGDSLINFVKKLGIEIIDDEELEK